MRLILIALFFVTLTAHADDAKLANSEATSTEVTATTAAVAPSAEANVDTALANKKESEIPLNLESPKKSSDESHPFFKFLLAVSLMGVVGTGAYFFVRKYSKTNFAAGKNNQIKILTQHYLGPKKSLAIVRVAGESILIGVTDQNISMIKSLSLLDDEVPEASFSGMIQQDEDSYSNVGNYKADAEEEEFSIRGIKDVVSKKLKGMRSIQ